MDAQQKKAQSRKRNLIIASGVFAAVAIVYGVYWGTVLRFEESTDDAYVSGHMMQLTPEIGGTVVKISSEDTDRVEAGQTVVQLDVNDAQINFDKARQAFIQAVRETRQLMTSSRQLEAQIAARKTDLARAQEDLKRRQMLAGTEAISQEELSHARDAVAAAQAALDASIEQHQGTNDLLGNDRIEQQPRVQAAANTLREAWLALHRTQVKAPVAGFIARRNVQLGQRVAAGSPLMAIVPLENVWVDANFKEVQLDKIRIGQQVELTSDLYGSRFTYHGKVAGLSAGTGSAFSLLPAQNATGNWIKVVQRVPVRIALDPKELREHPLRVGLSMNVEVSTRDQSGPVLPETPATTSPQETRVLTPDLKQADALIKQLLAANAQ
ncbi:MULTISPECIES: HlyD family efflux transporter periplasmic adaptor subunit [unclassified Paludibacterium]|uniref:HlyD family secretion protein n=1 Tax=unclassified Paludibacterium TaxID=2618429 RepID=UPI001C04257E|nr:HlyD family efflux transporter periplasmic adaptor subunit [Paludibacterium sp. B53371]BEV73125.1 EmrA/EmrK family multidrug efflux transporter periplasmic adaptor subunit [Paludibacterium sp. THUN1379]